MTAIYVVDVIDQGDDTYRLIWSNGRMTTATAEQLAAVERREHKLGRAPKDAA